METWIPVCTAVALVVLIGCRWLFRMTDMAFGMTAIVVQLVALAVLVIPAMVA